MAITTTNNVIGTTVTVKEKGLGYNVTITPKTNYVWKGGKVTVTFHDPKYSHTLYDKKITLTIPSSGTETVSGNLNDWTQGDPTVTFDGDVTNFTGEHLYYHDLVNNIPNTSVVQEDKGEREYSGIQTYCYLYLHITCDSGFKMIRDTIKLNGANVPRQTWSDDDTKCTLKIRSNTNSLYDTRRTLTGETVSTGTNIKNNITGDVTETHTIDGTNVSVTVTGNGERAKFVGVTVTYVATNGETKTIVPEQTTNIINVVLNDVKQGTTVTLNGAYRLVCVTANDMTGCDVAGMKDFYVENEVANITATATAKTHFDPENLPFAQWVTTSHGTTEHPFTLSEDGKTATLNFTFPNDVEKVSDSTFTLLGGTVPDVEITGYGSINVYLVNTKTLNEFSKIRFTKKLNDSYEYEYYDIAQYVNSLHKVFVDVPNVSKTSLKLANFDTGIETNSVDDSKVHVDFGTVLLPSYSNNSNDFNVNIQCFVPFVGFVQIDSDFMGKSINLSYDIDLVTGYCAYNLKCDDIVINNGVTNCSSEIIYKTLANDEVGTVGDSSYLNSVLMGFEPYITVKYYDSLADSINSTKKQVTINTVNGYAQFENVSLNTANLLVDEYNEIISQLETGVYL